MSALEHARERGCIEFRRAAPEIATLEPAPKLSKKEIPIIVIAPEPESAPEIDVVGDIKAIRAEADAFSKGRVTF